MKLNIDRRGALPMPSPSLLQRLKERKTQRLAEERSSPTRLAV
jgi:hypothetical protein